MQTGDRLSHYRIVGKIGEGGMGVVCRAEDVRLGRPVALKVLAAHLAADALARRRFESEARAASALDHPNICALYDVGETPDAGLFLALAYCEGETLRAALERGPIEPVRALAIAAQVADGLAVAHDKGIVHRDVKPANLMLRPDGLVKILDFGVAKLGQDAGITGTTESVGSPAYMAPEQIRFGRVGPPADVWSLGVVLYEMLTGRRPFEGEGIHTVLARILNDAPPTLGVLRPGLHPDLAAIVSRALTKEVESRISGAREFAAALRAVGRGSDDRTRDFRSALPPTTTAKEPATIAPPPAQGPESASLAVLPFSDMDPGRDQDTQLVKVADGSVLASSRYDHDLDDVFASSARSIRVTSPSAAGSSAAARSTSTRSGRRRGLRWPPSMRSTTGSGPAPRASSTRSWNGAPITPGRAMRSLSTSWRHSVASVKRSRKCRQHWPSMRSRSSSTPPSPTCCTSPADRGRR